eukprot:4765958-Heterocapsa_arctica.AAC.1
MEVLPEVVHERCLDGLPCSGTHRQDDRFGNLLFLPNLTKSFLGHGVRLDQRGHELGRPGFCQR